MSGFCYPPTTMGSSPIPGTVLSPALCTGLLPKPHKHSWDCQTSFRGLVLFHLCPVPWQCLGSDTDTSYFLLLFFFLIYFLSTSSNVISHVCLPCASSFLIPFLPLHTHILFHLPWCLLSFPHMLPAEKLLLLTGIYMKGKNWSLIACSCWALMMLAMAFFTCHRMFF